MGTNRFMINLANIVFKKNLFFIFLFLIFNFSKIYAQPAQPLINLNHQVQNQIHKTTPKASIGILIQELSPGNSIILARNSTQEFIPASNMKILTAITAMKILGPGYQFKTTVSQDPQDLTHTLYFKFSGDPSLSSSDLLNLINNLNLTFKPLGIKNITGNIILDTSAETDSNTGSANPDYPAGIDHADLAYWFMAPAQSIILNQNCIEIGTGKNSALMADPNPLLTAEHVITLGLENNHINFSGHFINQQTPLASTTSSHLKIIAEHDSEPLPNLINNMLPLSNNLYASSLTKAIGLKATGMGSFQSGAESIDLFIQSFIKNFNHSSNLSSLSQNHVIKDGAGLSRDNRMTPQDFVIILQAAYADPVLKTMLFNSLPRSGISGSLKYRMSQKLLLGNVYAKTGSMKGISTLSGYLKSNSGKIFVFSIMVNNLSSFIIPGRDLQDKILADLAHKNN